MLVGGSALQAQEDKTGWSIRLNGTWTIPDRNHFNNSGFVRLQTITDETFGLALSTEYRFWIPRERSWMIPSTVIPRTTLDSPFSMPL
jgi:hypothetical protein